MGRDLGADSDANLWAMWRHLGRATVQGRVDEDDDILIVETGSTLPTFNPVFVRRVPGSTIDDAAALVRRAIDRVLPVIVTINPSVHDVDRLVAAALATGLVRQGPLPGMALPDLRDREQPAGPRELVVEAVDSSQRWSEYFDVLCTGFEVPLELVRPITDPAVYRATNVVALAGKVRGKIVATSLAFVDGDTAGVYNVATLPGHRRRGYGQAMTWAAMAWGRDRKCDVAVLQASEMGRPIYDRMGFAEVAPYVQMVAPA